MGIIQAFKIPENSKNNDQPDVEIISDDEDWDNYVSQQKKQIDFNNLTESAVLYSNELMDMCPESH